MDVFSNSIDRGGKIPEKYAMGRLSENGGVEFSGNVSPHIAWSGLPAGTKSVALLCKDIDVPGSPELVNHMTKRIPADLERVEFFHWIVVDLNPSLGEIKEGAFSNGVVKRGKHNSLTFLNTRQGVNDYTDWFASDEEMSGTYCGYDGPFPPWNDDRIHRYYFTVYALDIANVPLPQSFTGHMAEKELAKHTIDSASFFATYSLSHDHA